MVGAVKLVFQQGFDATSTIPVEHGANSALLDVRVIVTSGTASESRADLISEVALDASDPLNKLTVTLTSPDTGTVQIFKPDTAASPLLSATDKLRIVKPLVGSDGITVISGSNEDTVQGFRTEFVTASGSLQSQLDSPVGRYFSLHFNGPGTTGNKWMANSGKDPLSNETPALMLFSSRLIGISYANKEGESQCNLEIYTAPLGAGNADTLFYIWEITSNTRVAIKTNLPGNLNLGAGEKLGIFLDKIEGEQEPVNVVVELLFEYTGDTMQELSETYEDDF